MAVMRTVDEGHRGRLRTSGRLRIGLNSAQPVLDLVARFDQHNRDHPIAILELVEQTADLVFRAELSKGLDLPSWDTWRHYASVAPSGSLFHGI